VIKWYTLWNWTKTKILKSDFCKPLVDGIITENFIWLSKERTASHALHNYLRNLRNEHDSLFCQWSSVLVDQPNPWSFTNIMWHSDNLRLHRLVLLPLCFHLFQFPLTIDYVFAWCFFCNILLCRWVIWNNKSLSLTFSHSLFLMVISKLINAEINIQQKFFRLKTNCEIFHISPKRFLW